MSRLFVIEAPGKARALEGILQRLGYESRVQATRGHLFQMPETLDTVGIDSAFREFERKPRDIDLVRRLREEAKLADEVFIATDADAEGDVIAWDVAETIRDLHPDPHRVRLKGMDDDSVLEAIETSTAVEKHDAIPGRTRAIIDRLIGAGYSGGGVAVGRVGTALLGVVQKQTPSVFRLRLVAPAKDGGRPWVAEADVEAPIDRAIARQLAELSLPALEARASRDVVSNPPHTGDIMVRAGDKLDMSPKEVATSMQRLYEGGRMSYPRAGSRGLSPSAVSKMTAILRKAGYKVDEGNYTTKKDDDVHDAPHPLGGIDVGKDPEKLGHDEGVRTMVARDLVKSGQRHRCEFPLAQDLIPFIVSSGFTREVAMAVAGMPWTREIGPRYPGQESWPESKVVARRADVVLLERAVALGLGRPSTWGNHIEQFMKRGLVDEDLKLTERGREWIARSPAELLDPRVSAAIEQACERPPASALGHAEREPWELNAERIVKALPPNIRTRVEGLVVHEQPRPKIDPVVAYGQEVDVMAEVAEHRSRFADLAPRPRGEDL